MSKHFNKINYKRLKSYLLSSFAIGALGLVCLQVPDALSQETTPSTTGNIGLLQTAPIRPSTFDASAYVEGGITGDILTKDKPNWNSQYLSVLLPFQANGLFFAQVDNVNRFSLSDQDINLLYAYPTQSGVINVMGSYSSSANFLPRTSEGFEWDGHLPQDFGYILGATQKQYVGFNSDTYSLGAEKYFGNYRVAYTALISNIDQTQTSFESKFQFQWFGSNNNRLGFTYVNGMEPNLIAIGNLESIHSEYVQVDGLYWVNNKVGITAALWHGLIGDYYQRNGAQIGVRALF